MIEIVQGDTMPYLDFTIKKGSNVLNLTGHSVVFSMRDEQNNIVIDKSECSIEDAVNGICRYQLLTGDSENYGLFFGEVQVTNPGGKVQTNYTEIPIRIRKQIA
jgi:hypothetical protein